MKYLKKMMGIALVAAVAAGLSWPGSAHASGTDRLKVVASTLYFADLVGQIGGDRVDVKHVASPRFNVHFIQPRPSDVRNVAKADLFVFGGLDLEAWVDPLLEAAGNRQLFRGGERNVDLSRGIPLLGAPAKLDRGQGDIHAFGNPHYVSNPEFARQMAGTLTEALKAADPEGTERYQSNLDRFLSRLDVKLIEWKSAVAGLKGKEIVAYHEDVAYLADFAGLKAEVFVEPKPGIPPTPKQIQYLEAYIPEHGVRAITAATYFPRGTLNELSKRTGVPVITLIQNAGEVPGTEDLFSYYDYNIKALAEGLK